MEHITTRWKIEHLMKVALWKQTKEKGVNVEYLPWLYLYFCGSNILCMSHTREGLEEQMKEFADIAMLPKVLYTPPLRSRKIWFDKDFNVPEDDLRLELESSVTCIGPVKGGIIGVETYEFSPWEILLMSKHDLRDAFYTFCLCLKRMKISSCFIPRQILMLIWHFYKTTTNIGFHL